MPCRRDRGGLAIDVQSTERLTSTHQNQSFMTLDVEVRLAGDIVVARTTGVWPELDREILIHTLEHWSRVTHLCFERNVRRVLSISEVAGAASSSAALRIHSHPEDFGWDRSIRMAVVCSDARTRQIIGMAVEVSKRNGWPFELFASELDGLEWLCSEATS